MEAGPPGSEQIQFNIRAGKVNTRNKVKFLRLWRTKQKLRWFYINIIKELFRSAAASLMFD